MHKIKIPVIEDGQQVSLFIKGLEEHDFEVDIAIDADIGLDCKITSWIDSRSFLSRTNTISLKLPVIEAESIQS